MTGVQTCALPISALPDARPLLEGTAAPLEVVSLSADTEPVLRWTVQADERGDWATVPPASLPEGSVTLTIGQAPPIPLVIDTTAPALSLVGFTTQTQAPEPTLRGTAEPGAEISLLGRPGPTTTADAAGDWSLPWGRAPLVDGARYHRDRGRGGGSAPQRSLGESGRVA